MTDRHRTPVLTALVVVVIVAAGWLAYQPALSGTFLLDDVANLGGLAQVDDGSSALHFVLSGDAGPLGRPLALASFLPQAEQWEQGARAFLTVNIAIHLLNGCLVGWFLYLLTRARGHAAPESRQVALIAMALWLLMPLLASSTLMVVQRMTTLSATFVLLGLNAYLLARSSRSGRGSSLTGMSTVLVAATFLAVLTKESGALLPVFVLVLELTLLSPPVGLSRVQWRGWVAVFLVLPAVLILAYLAYRAPYGDALVLKRDFTAWQRILTQAGILWEYLFNAFLPRPGQYGPYHDAHPVARSALDPLVLLAGLAWLALVALAAGWRRRYSLFAFAVLWFVGGHLLESTTIPLELYFEHRNYLPILGPVYALSCLPLVVSESYRRSVLIALPLYAVLNAFVLFSLASLWGQPATAAEYWHRKNPGSVRAATSLATQRLATDGPEATRRMLTGFAAEHPEHAYLRLPALTLSCILSPSSDHASEARAVGTDLRQARFAYTTGTMLSELLTTVQRQPCTGVDVDVVRNLAMAVMSNPRYRADERYRHFHHRLMASMARQDGDTDGVFDHLQEAAGIQPTPELNMMFVTTLVSEGRFAEARAFLERAENQAPLNPLARIAWRMQLAELETYVERAESFSEPVGDGATGTDNGAR